MSRRCVLGGDEAGRGDVKGLGGEALGMWTDGAAPSGASAEVTPAGAIVQQPDEDWTPYNGLPHGSGTGYWLMAPGASAKTAPLCSTWSLIHPWATLGSSWPLREQ